MLPPNRITGRLRSLSWPITISSSSAAASTAPASRATRPGAGCRVLLVEQDDLARRHPLGLVQADPRRPALPRAVRVPPGARGAARARGAAAHRAAHRPAAAFVLPRQPGLRPRWMIRARPVALRPARRPRRSCRDSHASTSPHHALGAPLQARVRARLRLFGLLGRRCAAGRAQRARRRRARRDDPHPHRLRCAPSATATWRAIARRAAAAARRHRAHARQRRRARGSRRARETGCGAGDRATRAPGQGQPHRRAASCSTSDHAYILQNADGRVVFVLPYEERLQADRHHRRAGRRRPRCRAIGAEEIDYLCARGQRATSRSRVSPSDVVLVLCRRAPALRRRRRQRRGRHARLHLELDERARRAPLLSVFGGKITTYRRLAEDGARQACASLPACTAWTATTPLPGGDFRWNAYRGHEWRRHARPGRSWAEAEAWRLLRAYGTRVERILAGRQAGARTSAPFFGAC